jgi:hypothetical protein
MPPRAVPTSATNEGPTVAGITTIVHFTMPRENVDEFFATWTKIKEFMLKQPGALDGTMHRSIDDDSPFQLVNVAHWESPEALANALRASAEDFKSRGTDLAALMQRLAIRVSQNNYIEAAKY